MDDPPLQPNRDPQLDEAVWNAWVKRNESKDKVRLARRKKLLSIILLVGVVVLLIWDLAVLGMRLDNHVT